MGILISISTNGLGPIVLRKKANELVHKLDQEGTLKITHTHDLLLRYGKMRQYTGWLSENLVAGDKLHH